ncbi:MAG: bifunctional 4-hydroxy-2-oxoglutarate aldolase/2-dehydro-3-deoxy-phosphogluconate aldolase [Mycetocola sp.]
MILRGLGAEATVRAARDAWQTGIEMVEVPLQSERDEESLAAAAAEAATEGRVIGAGTITSIELCATAKKLGAAYVVTPGLDLRLCAAALDLELPCLPGVATPTEVQAASNYGLLWQKGFPASILGTAWFKAMSGPFPQVRFVATGGMNASTAIDYLRSGVSSIGVSGPATAENLRTLRNAGEYRVRPR